MVVGIKDAVKPIGISIVACCAVFVCTLFLNYNIDLSGVDASALTEQSRAVYEAQRSIGKVVTAVSGGCLVVTSVIMLVFYIKNHIDAHGKELGILKALGYSNISVAVKFWIFGLSVFIGCAVGFAAAFAYLPRFYDVNNAEKLLPDMAVRFHIVLPLCLIAAPSAVFTALSVLFAYIRLKTPPLDLMREKRETAGKRVKDDGKDKSFLGSLKGATLKSKKILVFFIAFSAFCFSAMVQMSISMTDLSSATFAWLIFSIGLILAFMTLLMSLRNAVKGNEKTIAMMRIFGYDFGACARGVLGVYRPFSYIGFVIGTLYQYGLLKITMTYIFTGPGMPEYGFDFKALFITAAAFIAVYELILFLYALRIKKLSLKSVMLE